MSCVRHNSATVWIQKKTSDDVAGLGWFPFVRVDRSSDSGPIVRVGDDRAERSEPSDRRSVL